MSKPNIFGATGLTGGVVNRDLDSIDGNAEGMVDGAAAVVITDSGTYHYHLDASSGAAENSPYVIKPDTNAGDKRWLLIAPVGPMSHVKASIETAQSIPNSSWEKVIFSTENHDTLSEYDPTTGKFTAKNSGEYLVSYNLRIYGGLAYPAIYKNGIVYKKAGPFVGSSSDYILTIINTTVTMSVNDYIETYILNGGSSTYNTHDSPDYNFLTIDRLV